MFQHTFKVNDRVRRISREGEGTIVKALDDCDVYQVNWDNDAKPYILHFNAQVLSLVESPKSNDYAILQRFDAIKDTHVTAIGRSAVGLIMESPVKLFQGVISSTKTAYGKFTVTLMDKDGTLREFSRDHVKTV